jgi:hypothetical protein
MRGEVRVNKGLLKEEMLTKMEIHHERMMARMDSQLEETEACLGKTRGHGFGGKSRRNRVRDKAAVKIELEH